MHLSQTFIISLSVCRLIPRFGRLVPQLCMTSNQVIDYIVDTYGQLLRSLNEPFLSQENLQTFADAIHQKGATLDNCWGFIDGTVRFLANIQSYQYLIFSSSLSFLDSLCPLFETAFPLISF